MKTKIILILASLLLIKAQILWADQATFNISVVIPSIPGVNTNLNTSNDTISLVSNYNFISEEIMREDKRVILETFTED